MIVIWEAPEWICDKRLRPLVPILIEAMERHGHLQFAREIRTKSLGMSAARSTRRLRDVRWRAIASRIAAGRAGNLMTMLCRLWQR
jgi:hypothetical protein